MSVMPRPMDASYKMLIDGKFVDASNGAIRKSFCPANGEFLASFPDATKEDVDAAVKAAWKAFASWKNVSVTEKQAILMKIADVIDANKETLAMIESLAIYALVVCLIILFANPYKEIATKLAETVAK